MQLPVFEHAYLLQSLGWAIINSLWQSACLWALYKLITGVDKRLTAQVKYNLGLLLMTTTFTWFLFTFLQNYRLLTNASPFAESFLPQKWILDTVIFTSSLPFLSIAYVIFLAFHTQQFIKNLFANQHLQKEGLSKAPVDFRLFTTATALNFGIKKKVHVWLSEQVDVPCVTGFIKPVILLPIAISSHLSLQQIEAILLHELAHIKRNDYLVNILQSIVELILFFNPFVILLGKAVKKERENCCDDWVLNFQYNRFEYAKALLILEEERRGIQYRLALAATNDKKTLLQRVKRLFNPPQVYSSNYQKYKFISLCCLLFLAVISLLPYASNNSVNKNAVTSNQNKNLALYKFEPFNKENLSKKIFANQPIQPIKGKPEMEKRAKRKPIKKETGIEYVNAFINEALLDPAHQLTPVITQVIDKETNHIKYFVKIEEEQSGKKETNTYYFELNSNNGSTDITPLIILNKIKASGKKNAVKPLTDSTNSFKKPSAKKRITS